MLLSQKVRKIREDLNRAGIRHRYDRSTTTIIIPGDLTTPILTNDPALNVTVLGNIRAAISIAGRLTAGRAVGRKPCRLGDEQTPFLIRARELTLRNVTDIKGATLLIRKDIKCSEKEVYIHGDKTIVECRNLGNPHESPVLVYDGADIAAKGTAYIKVICGDNYTPEDKKRKHPTRVAAHDVVAGQISHRACVYAAGDISCAFAIFSGARAYAATINGPVTAGPSACAIGVNHGNCPRTVAIATKHLNCASTFNAALGAHSFRITDRGPQTSFAGMRTDRTLRLLAREAKAVLQNLEIC